MEWLVENLIPFSIVFTKSDKLKPSSMENNINLYKDKMLSSNWAELPPIFKTSSIHHTGIEEILNYINKLNKVVVENYHD